MSENSDVVDLVAECLRIERLGLIRPLWCDLEEDRKAEYRQSARRLISSVARRGLYLTEDSPND